MVPITVFTPTYNRADLLQRCYESMQRQTNKNFIWMIIDDGSTDATKTKVYEWLESSNDFEIQYYYKQNGGLHTAYNEAISHIETELCVCIDSDDYMPDNAIQIILDFWTKNGSDEYAGIVGLDFTLDGNVIGDKLPHQKCVNLIDLLIGKYSIINGDRTNVVRTDLYKRVAPMHVFEGEKNFNPHYMHLLISQDYDFLVLNENLRYVDYQANGMTNSMLKQYKNSPNSFAEIRKLYLGFDDTSVQFKFKHSIHLVSSLLLSHKINQLFSFTQHKALAFFALPFGAMLYIYIKLKA